MLDDLVSDLKTLLRLHSWQKDYPSSDDWLAVRNILMIFEVLSEIFTVAWVRVLRSGNDVMLVPRRWAPGYWIAWLLVVVFGGSTGSAFFGDKYKRRGASF